MYRMDQNLSSYSIDLGFSMLRPVSRKFQELVRELDVPSGSSFKMNTIVQPFIQLSYNMQLEVTHVLLTEFVKLVRIAPFPGTFS